MSNPRRFKYSFVWYFTIIDSRGFCAFLWSFTARRKRARAGSFSPRDTVLCFLLCFPKISFIVWSLLAERFQFGRCVHLICGSLVVKHPALFRTKGTTSSSRRRSVNITPRSTLCLHKLEMGALLEMEYVPLKFQLRRIEGDVAHKILSGPQGRRNYKVVCHRRFIRSGIENSRRVVQRLYSQWKTCLYTYSFKIYVERASP